MPHHQLRQVYRMHRWMWLWVGVLSTQVLDVQRVQFGSGRVLEQRSPILALALLHPMAVHAERTAVDDLEDAQRIEWIRIVEKSPATSLLHRSPTFRRILTRYGSRSASSTFSGSAVKRRRRIRTMARTHRMANRNFLRALNRL